MDVSQGAKFYSFAEFDAAFEQWKATHFHPFRVASSETLRMPDGSTNDRFKYRYIVYHCAHYGAPRMRGVGKRPNQNYMPCGCRAMLRLNYSWSENALRVTTLNPKHSGHEVSGASYAKFASKLRRPSPGISPESQPTSSPSLTSCPSPASSSPAPPSEPLSGCQKENELVAIPFGAVSQQTPLDLSATADGRTDEERFQQLHVVLQALTDHLLTCRGHDFDAKLLQMRSVVKGWQLKR